MRNIPRDLQTAGTGRPVLDSWVVFCGEPSLRLLKVLKPGFRHCLVLLFDGVNWVSVDPLLGRLEITVHQVPGHFDFPGFLQSQGLTVIQAGKPLQKNTIAPPMICTCVELVKRVLGIHRVTVMTPYQLYRYLLKRGRG